MLIHRIDPQSFALVDSVKFEIELESTDIPIEPIFLNKKDIVSHPDYQELIREFIIPNIESSVLKYLKNLTGNDYTINKRHT